MTYAINEVIDHDEAANVLPYKMTKDIGINNAAV